MVDIRREGQARDQLPRRGTRRTWPARAETEAGAAEGIRRAAPGESALVKLLAAWAARAGEDTKRRPNQVCAFVDYLKTGTTRTSGPAPYRAAWSLSSVDRESTRHERGQTQCGWNTASAPHTRQWHLSAVPLPPHSTTEQANLNKRPPPPACVRVEIRHWRDLQTEAK